MHEPFVLSLSQHGAASGRCVKTLPFDRLRANGGRMPFGSLRANGRPGTRMAQEQAST